MPQIDPKFMFWFGVWTSILMIVTSYGFDHAPPFIAQYAPYAVWFSGFFAKINTGILTAMAALSSNKPGIFITPPADTPTIPPAIVKILIAAFLLSAFLFAPPAMAQMPRARPALTGNPMKDIQTAVENQEQKTVSDIETALQKFGDFIGNDMTGAANLAISIPDLQDGNGQICFDAMANASKVFQANPVPTPSNSSNMPPIGVAMVVERIRLLAMTVNNVCNIPACTQIFADATGALSAAAPLKTPLPSLHDLCSNVPNIAVAKPTRTLPAVTSATSPAAVPAGPTPADTPASK